MSERAKKLFYHYTGDELNDKLVCILESPQDSQEEKLNKFILEVMRYKNDNPLYAAFLQSIIDEAQLNLNCLPILKSSSSGSAEPGKMKITDDNYTPPLRAAQIYSVLGINRGCLNAEKPLGKFYKKCATIQGNPSPRLPWGEFWAIAKSAVERSKSEIDREFLADINSFKELFLMP